MSAIVIHRCDLRIRRTSGWAWGASPEELIQAATRAIPQLLAARLPDLAVPGDGTIVIDRPVTVKITATARQLAALGDDTPATAEVADLRARISAEVAAAVAAAIASTGAVHLPAIAEAPVDEEASAAQLAHEAELASEEAPRRAARAWWRAGAIDAVLARLEPRALARLHELLLGDAPAAGEPASDLLAILEHAAAAHPGPATSPLEQVRRRIALAAAAIDARPTVTPAQLRAAIDRAVPLEATTAAGVAASARDDSAAAPTPAAAPRTVPRDPHAGDRAGELVIRSALPFLLLAPLRHAGWLDSARSLLAIHRLEPDAFALAAGLAAKVLDPIERGWARSPADRLAIAVFAGRSEAIADGELSAAAARLRPLLPALDAGLRAVIRRARRSTPVVVWREARGWYLLDTDGMVVLAAGEVLGELLTAAPPVPIVVPAQFAAREVFEAIDYANGHFITDAPPARGDAWRAFTGATGRLYTNDTATPAGKLAAATAYLEPSIALAQELAEVLAERPAIARDPLTAFEATCSLAATAALADIGARLFPAEATTPVLALTRFRDLDARVTVTADRLRVRVPLGQRHADLLRHGLLGELANVPWLNGRDIDLGGG